MAMKSKGNIQWDSATELSQIVQGQQKRGMPLGKTPPSCPSFAETVKFNLQGGRCIQCPFH